MKKFIESLENALRGLLLALKDEQNLKIHTVAALLILVLGLIVELTSTEWMLILLCIGSVFNLELVNTAIEELCNLIQPNYHKSIGKIKDISAGAVLASALISAVIGISIFVPHFLRIL